MNWAFRDSCAPGLLEKDSGQPAFWMWKDGSAASPQSEGDIWHISGSSSTSRNCGKTVDSGWPDLDLSPISAIGWGIILFVWFYTTNSPKPGGLQKPSSAQDAAIWIGVNGDSFSLPCVFSLQSSLWKQKDMLLRASHPFGPQLRPSAQRLGSPSGPLHLTTWASPQHGG